MADCMTAVNLTHAFTLRSFRSAFFRLIPVLATLVVSACTSIPSEPMPEGLTNQSPADWSSRQKALSAFNHWLLQGKIAVRQPEDSGSAVINHWQQKGEQYHLVLSSAFLGMGRTELKGTPGFLALTLSDGEVYRSSDPQSLIRAATGWQFPVDSLAWWVRGLPAPDGNFKLFFNDKGQLAAIRQQGWDIRIDRRKHFLPGQPALPARITALNGEKRIRLVVTNWQATDQP